MEGVAKSNTDAYILSANKLLQAVEARRYETQSPLRKLWRRLRKAGSVWGALGIWGVATIIFTLLVYILQPLVPCDQACLTAKNSIAYTLKTSNVVLFGSGAGIAAVLVTVVALIGFWIYHVKYGAEKALKVSGANDQTQQAKTQAKTNDQQKEDEAKAIPFQKRAWDFLGWCFGNPKSPTILSYMEVFWNWLHGKTDLDPAHFDKPKSVSKLVSHSMKSNNLLSEISDVAITAENLAQVVLLRTDQQLDEEKTRKRLMRVLAMFIGSLLAYLLQIDAAVLLDKALPGTSGLVNGLFIIKGSTLHATWSFLPATLNITPGVILTGLAASAGSAFWHDQLERLQAAKESPKQGQPLFNKHKTH